jgi:hypothetical protein
MTAGTGLQSFLLTLNGGTGSDTILGGDGADLIQGGEENDSLVGGAGPDRIVGDRGNDTVRGGTGDDTLVWNNGDGSDTMDGEEGVDHVEVNGAVAAGDVFTIAPNGGRATFQRTNLGPFTLDIGSTEILDARGSGGDDTFTSAPGVSVVLAIVVVDGGEGNDTLTGGDEANVLFGSSGNDTITGGAGNDTLYGGEGDDALLMRDGLADLGFCAAGNDSVVADLLGLDTFSNCETVDLPAAVPIISPDTTALAPVLGVTRLKTTGKASRTAIRVPLTCPASELGGCKGTLTVLSARTLNLGRGIRAILILASAQFSLQPGEAKQISLRLGNGFLRLANGKTFSARLQILSQDAVGNVVAATQALRITPPKKAKKKAKKRS